MTPEEQRATAAWLAQPDDEDKPLSDFMREARADAKRVNTGVSPRDADRGDDGAMTDTLTPAEQRANRIAMWRGDLLALIPPSTEADLANPEALLDSLTADLRAEERERMSRFVEEVLPPCRQYAAPRTCGGNGERTWVLTVLSCIPCKVRAALANGRTSR